MADQNDMESAAGRCSRREFLQMIALGGTAAFIAGSFGFFMKKGEAAEEVYSIVVDYNKCTGCRTCETVCSAANHPVIVSGKKMNGLGNPLLAHIKIHKYNPDMDVPAVCAQCPDSPCIRACPVPPDLKTGKKALYLDKKTRSKRNDPDRCLGCGECARACKKKSVGVIRIDSRTGKPAGICTLCDGDPQCVKYCPFGALSYVKLDSYREFYRMSPDEVAGELCNRFYHVTWKES